MTVPFSEHTFICILSYKIDSTTYKQSKLVGCEAKPMRFKMVSEKNLMKDCCGFYIEGQ